MTQTNPQAEPQRTYLDNASTSFPKPPCVPDAVYAYMTRMGTNAGRGEYAGAFETDDLVLGAREKLCDLLGGEDPSCVVFTRNVTEALNLVLKGSLRAGDHVIASSMEHNAVMRPLTQLAARGVEFSRVPCAPDGTLNPADVAPLMRPNTRMVVMTHASNVCGTALPLAEVGRVCREHGACFVVDAAQTAGVLPVDARSLCADAVCFTGHKGLLGPQGIGGAVLTREFARTIEPLVAGGTGSASSSEEMPGFLPDALEAGTLNLPGIAGLSAALDWVSGRGTQTICAHEQALAAAFIDGLGDLETSGAVRVVGLRGAEGRTGVVSIQTPGHELAEVAHTLDADHGIQTRVGLHCAPSAHKTLGTFPTGTIRFSFGWANTNADVVRAVNALERILR